VAVIVAADSKFSGPMMESYFSSSVSALTSELAAAQVRGKTPTKVMKNFITSANLHIIKTPNLI
jgi:hypothetical protein